jgi:large subunit ribosomal protein L29
MAKKANDKFGELSAFEGARLLRELDETYKQMFVLRKNAATRQLQNVKEIGKVRRKIARIKTLQRQRELGIVRAPAAPEPAPSGRRRRTNG